MAGRAAPYPPREEMKVREREREREASKGVREAVCILGRGMLEGQGTYNGPIVQE